MFLNMDQLQKQLDNNEFQEIGSMASFKVLETQFQMFIKSKIYLNDEYIVMTRNYFLEYTRLDIPEFRDTLIQNMDYVKKSIEKRALHKMEYDSRVNERLMQTTEEKVDSSKALDASLVIIESNGTESQKQDTSSRSGNDAHVNDADIRPIYNEEPMAEGEADQKFAKKESMREFFNQCCMDWGKVNPVIAYYNGYCKLKHNEIQAGYKFQDKRTHKTILLWKCSWIIAYTLWMAMQWQVSLMLVLKKKTVLHRFSTKDWDILARRVWVYIPRFKHEAFGKFKEWKQLVENHTRRTVKKLMTDNGLEFCNREFEQLCVESGIARHLIVVGTL
ncbi:reverse transcriptase domain-containing protein [Tanacetum coccineum]